MLAIAFIAYSAATPVLVQIIYYAFQKQDLNANYPGYSYFSFTTWFQDANMTAWFFSWFFLLLVLFPYVIFYKGTSLYRLGFIYKFLFFFFLMLLSGIFLVPWGFVTEFFLLDKYPQKILLLFSLSVVMCPVVNLVLNNYLKVKGEMQHFPSTKKT